MIASTPVPKPAAKATPKPAVVPPWLRAGPHADVRATPWAQAFTLAAMFVYIGKIADIFPLLAPPGLGKALIVLAVAALLLEGGGWRQGILRDPLVRPFLGIVALAVLTFPLGVWPGNSYRFLTDVMVKEVLFMFLLMLTTHTHQDLRRVIWVFAFNVLVLDYALLRYGSLGVGQVFLGRNEVAMYSVIALALLLPLRTGRVAWLLKWATITVIVVSVFASQSRGSYLGFAVVTAAYLYLRLGRQVALSAVISMLAAYVIYVQLPSDYRGSVDSIINYEQDYNLTAREGRIEVWKRGLIMVRDNPFMGVGIGNFAVAEGLMHAHVRGQPWLTAHNSPLQVAGEIGLAGLALFLILITRMFRIVRRLSEDADVPRRALGRSLLLAMVAYAVTGSFLSQAFAVVFYVLIALVLVANRAAGPAGAKGTELAAAATERRPAHARIGTLHSR